MNLSSEYHKLAECLLIILDRNGKVKVIPMFDAKEAHDQIMPVTLYIFWRPL